MDKAGERLGYLIMQAQTTNRTDIMCLCLAIYAILGQAAGPPRTAR